MAAQDPLDALSASAVSAERAPPKAVAPAALAVVRIVDEAALRSLEPEWRELWRATPGATPFTSFEWQHAWWRAYADGRALCLLTFRVDATLVGIAPLYVDRLGPARACRVLRLVGDGSFDSDYLDILARGDARDAVMQRLGDWLAASREWDVALLRELPADSAALPAMTALAQRARLLSRVEHGRSAVLDLPGSFEAFVRARQSRFRTRLRAMLRRLDDGNVVFEHECTPAQLRARLRSLFRLHQARWRAAGGTGVFGGRDKRAFYAHFATAFLRNGWLRLYSLRCGDAYVAHQLCFGERGVTYLLQEGFDTSDAAASYGQLLRTAVVRHLIERGERRYDFLGGFSRHKEDWGAVAAETAHVLVARRNLRGRLYFHAPAVREHAATFARRVLPPALVERLRRLAGRAPAPQSTQGPA